MKVELWFDHHAEAIYRYIFFMVKDHHIAEDLTQDTFIRAHINSKQFKGKSAVKTWLYRIAYTTTMNYFRRNHPIKTFFNTSVHKSSAEEVFFNQNDLDELYRAITKMKLTYQQVIILRKIQQLSVKETASILNWGESKVKMTLSRALTKLREIVNEQGGIK